MLSHNTVTYIIVPKKGDGKQLVVECNECAESTLVFYSYLSLTFSHPVFISSDSAVASASAPGLFLKQRRGEVSFGGIRQDGNDSLTFAQFPGKLDGSGHVGAAGDAAHDTFF